MAFVEKFLGKRVEIPEDRRYCIHQGLWVVQDGLDLTFGLSEPALVLLGGLKGVDWLVAEGSSVETGTDVVFAVTGKILYLETPVAGKIHFNGSVRERPSLVAEQPYGEGWLFRIRFDGALELPFVGAAAYLEGLKSTEGFKNPEGIKGGVSGICKAVYTGIREQMP
jgi:glycine cleavage system H protein